MCPLWQTPRNVRPGSVDLGSAPSAPGPKNKPDLWWLSPVSHRPGSTSNKPDKGEQVQSNHSLAGLAAIGKHG